MLVSPSYSIPQKLPAGCVVLGHHYSREKTLYSTRVYKQGFREEADADAALHPLHITDGADVTFHRVSIAFLMRAAHLRQILPPSWKGDYFNATPRYANHLITDANQEHIINLFFSRLI